MRYAAAAAVLLQPGLAAACAQMGASPKVLPAVLAGLPWPQVLAVAALALAPLLLTASAVCALGRWLSGRPRAMSWWKPAAGALVAGAFFLTVDAALTGAAWAAASLAVLVLGLSLTLARAIAGRLAGVPFRAARPAFASAGVAAALAVALLVWPPDGGRAPSGGCGGASVVWR